MTQKTNDELITATLVRVKDFLSDRNEDALPSMGEVDISDDGSTVAITGVIDSGTYAAVIDHLNDAEGPLTFILNSGGGDVFAGLGIYSAIRDYAEGDDNIVTAKVFGLAGSAASIIMAAADERVMDQGGQVMIHMPWGLAIGEAKDLRRTADALDSIADGMTALYSARFGGTANSWMKVMEAETWYTAERAKKAGVATSVRAVASVEKAVPPVEDEQTEPTDDELAAIENDEKHIFRPEQVEQLT